MSMKRSAPSRLLSWLLILTMVFSMIPLSALAAEESAVYTKIASADELTTGQYVMVTETGYAPTVLDGSWVLAEAVTADGDTIPDPAANLVWTLTVDGTTVKLTDSNGVSVAPKGGNNNGIASGDYSWSFTFANGTFQFFGQGSDTVVLASNKGSETSSGVTKPPRSPETPTVIPATSPCTSWVMQPWSPRSPSFPPPIPPILPWSPKLASMS